MHIILADDHTLFREAFAFYLAKAAPDLSLDVTADLHGAMEILDYRRGEVALVLLDLHMPGMSGIGGLEKIRQAFPDVAVVLLSGLAEERDVYAAQTLGARGYLPKTMPLRVLLDGMRTVLAGNLYFARDHTGRALPSYKRDGKMGPSDLAPAAKIPPLTPREHEVLNFLSTGTPNKLIADRLGLQLVTVKLHVRNLCRKLGVVNRTQAALRAKEFGL